MLARLLFGEALVCHMLDAHVDQVVHIAVGERAVRITPFAIMLVKLAVFVVRYYRLVVKRHAAALIYVRSVRAQKRVDRNVKQLGKQFQRFGVRSCFARFPARHRLSCDKNFFRKLVLRHPLFQAKFRYNLFRFHSKLI